MKNKKTKSEAIGKFMLLVAVCYLIIVVACVIFFLYFYVKSYAPTSPDYSVDIELFYQNDAENKIIWKVRGYSGLYGANWTNDFLGKLRYTNGTEITNCTKFPSGRIKVGDLIEVIAPWDGDAEFILVHIPTGEASAKTSIEHY